MLFDDEVRRPIQIGVGGLRWAECGGWIVCTVALVLQGVRILANVVQELLPLVVLLGPLGHIVRGFLFLKSLENDLIFTGDFHELTLTSLSIETFLVDRPVEVHEIRSGALGLCADLSLKGVVIGMGDALGVLQNVRHLLKQDPILALDLRIPLYTHMGN